MSRTNRGAFRLLFVAALALGGVLAVLAVSTTRAQQQSKEQASCIVAVNKAVRGVSRAEGKLVGSCLKDAGKTDPQLTDDCIASDLKGRVGTARGKTAAAIATSCAVPPDFGFTDASTANDAAVTQELALLADIFGNDYPTAVISSVTNPAGARCQQIAQKTYEKILQAQLKTFEGCKKSGLKNGSIDSQAALAACLDAVSADARGRIGKAVIKFADSVAAACAGVNTAAAFPGDCSSPGFADCVEAKSTCRACLLIDQADATGVYCDVFDNGTADASCVDPRRCGNGALEAGEDCDDGNNTSGDCCSATCTTEPAGQACPSDGNPCTNDVCNSGGACLHNANTAPCNDGSFCNGADTCAGGACAVHAGNPCPGADGDGNCSESCDETADNCLGADPNGSPCPDTTFCNGADTCTGGACTHAGNPCAGADGDGNCSESCNETSDNCLGADPDGSACTDGVFCNGTDTCSSGACSAHAGNPCPGADGDANCAESCDETADDCDSADPNGSACTDSLFCNGADACSGGACAVHAGDPCGGPDGDADCSDTCDESVDACTGFEADGSACDDGLFCNGADTCASGACTFHPGDPCPGADGDADCSETCDETADACSGDDTNGAACDDGLFCNGVDFCSAGACSLHTGSPCAGADGDGNCAESCNEAADNCVAPDPNGSACDDGLFCTGADACFNGSCSAHTGDPCSGPDGDANCAESCSEAADDCSANDADGAPCSDGTFCNGNDTCSGGACSAHAGNPCPGADGDGNCSESCNEAADNCAAADPNGSACNDGTFCNGADTCSGGSCSAHAGNPCSGPDGDGNCSESCNEAADNCTAADPNGSACNDGTFCNGTDTCSSGVCSAHAGNPCPGADGDSNCAESCNEAADNCTASDPNGSSCNDGLFCNGTDTCSSGACSTHAGNPCPGADGDGNCSESCNETSDNCAAADPNGSACNDGQSCNGSDSCSSGSCVGSGTCCGTVDFTFTVNSSSGGAFSSAQWPGGTQTQSSAGGCSVTINNPNNNIDLVCTLAAPFSVNTFAGFQNCVGQGGEDGDGCEPVSCPFAGIGSCCSARPSCSVATNGSGSARYHVHCTDP